MTRTLNDVDKWPETKTIMDNIEKYILNGNIKKDITMKDIFEQLLVLQRYVNAQAALWEEYGRTRCFASPEHVASIYRSLESEVEKARGFVIERKNDDG